MHPSARAGSSPPSRWACEQKDALDAEDEEPTAGMLPTGDVDNPRWETATRAWTSTEGASGVIFIEVISGILVIKGSSRIAEEVYASILARRVGIQAPKMRIIEYTSNEWANVKVQLERSCLRLLKLAN